MTKPIYVVIEKSTGDFWSQGGKRKVQAYTSPLKAWAAVRAFWPRVDESLLEVKEFTVNETK